MLWDKDPDDAIVLCDFAEFFFFLVFRVFLA